MWLRKTADILTYIASPTAKVLNIIAAGFLAAMMVLTGVDVFLRYIFNRPVTGSYEMTEFMMPIVIAFGLAYCAVEKGHVRVELVILRLPERAQVVMHIFANLVFLAVFILITWQTFLRAKGMFDVGQTSIVLYIPVFPFVLAVAIGGAALCLVVLRDLFAYLSQAVRK
jgi:TRAP-type C4-dicarboxylate transport system permease small subunit